MKKIHAIVTMVTAVAAASQAFDTVYTWDNGGTNYNWSMAENWDADTVPVSGNIQLRFQDGDGASYRLNNDLGTLRMRKMDFVNTPAWVVQGDSIELGGTTADGSEMKLYNAVQAVTLVFDINENPDVANKEMELELVNSTLVINGTLSGSESRHIKVNLSGASFGTLRVTGEITSQGDINLTSSGALFELKSTGEWTSYIHGAGTNNAVIGTGSASLDGTLILDLSGASATENDSWQIVELDSTNVVYGADFNVDGFTESESGVWDTVTNGMVYTFAESNSTLTVTGPEPEDPPESASLQIAASAGTVLVTSTNLSAQHTHTIWKTGGLAGSWVEQAGTATTGVSSATWTFSPATNEFYKLISE